MFEPVLVKPKPNSVTHSPPTPPTPPRAKHIRMSHTPPTPLTTHFFSTSRALDNTHELRATPIYPLTTTTPPLVPTPALPSPSYPNSLAVYTHATQTTVHTSQSPQQPHPQHRVPRQPHIETKDYHRTTTTTPAHRPSIKSTRNLIILQVNIYELKYKLEELKLRIHDTHAHIITIQETKVTPNVKTPKVHNFATVRNDTLHNAGGGLITLIPSTINTHNTELQMVKVHINNTKNITVALHTYYKTSDTDLHHCIQHITNIPQSVLTGDVNAHSNLWHPYTEDHRGQLIADVISNSDHITLNNNTPTRVPNTTLQQTSSPDITTVYNTLYNWTS